MKARIFTCALCIFAIGAVNADASVFSGSGSTSLQGVLQDLGYGYIDATDYQKDINFELEGMMRTELLSKSTSSLSLNDLEKETSWWGDRNNAFGPRAAVGATSTFAMRSRGSSYGFYIARPTGRLSGTAYASSGLNRGGATKTLFYRDPLVSSNYLSQGLSVGSTQTSRTYDNTVAQLGSGFHRRHFQRREHRTVQPAPEPSTWVLLASGALLLGLFVQVRRRQTQAS